MEEVVSDVLGDEHIEWLEPERSWAAHIKVTGASGVVGYLLASPEWQDGTCRHVQRPTSGDGDVARASAGGHIAFRRCAESQGQTALWTYAERVGRESRGLSAGSRDVDGWAGGTFQLTTARRHERTFR